MITLNEYLADPCGTLSIPYWKAKQITVPGHIQIVHDRDFDPQMLLEWEDTVFFRLRHDFRHIPPAWGEDMTIDTVIPQDLECIVQIINASYPDIRVTPEQIKALTQTPVYAPRLWLMARDKTTGANIGCAIADFDPDAQELIIEWVQVLPEYRRRRIGAALILELLRRRPANAKFATVSGKEPTALSLYRICGFRGFDFWHIMTKK